MNFINDMAGQEIHVELKYCERCGGLWLRALGTGGVYCSSCRACLAAMLDPGEAPPRRLRRRRKASGQEADVEGEAQRGDLQSLARIEYLQAVAVMEVWA